MAMAFSSSSPTSFGPPRAPATLPLLASPRVLSCSLASRRPLPPRNLRLRICLCGRGDRGRLFLGFSQPQCSSLAAVGDVTAVPNECTEDTLSSHENSGGATVDATSFRDKQGVQDGKSDQKPGDNAKMVRVCDKLIEVFMVDKPTTTDWRRLLAFSGEWDNIRPHFYNRCQERANAETNPEMKHKLLRLGRKLKEVDDDVQRHNELLEVVKSAPLGEISSIVARRRKDFTNEFFIHLHTVAESYYKDPVKQNELAKLGNDCIAAVQAHDNTSETMEALNAAELKLQDIINSPTVDAACRKIDDLAGKNELDSTLVLMLTKAWSAAKDTDMTKDEVKDVLYHLYKAAVGNLQRQMPKEVRIIKYLLTIEDPEERLSALSDAFTPGVELEGQDVDSLYTTPVALHTWARTVVDAYHFSREGTLLREARDLMNPKIIQKLEEITKLIKDKFL